MEEKWAQPKRARLLKNAHDCLFLSTLLTSDLILSLFFLNFLGLHPWHLEVLRLGVKSELWVPAYTTAIATRDPNLVCDLHHSSWQCRIPDPQSKGSNPHRHGYWSGLLPLSHNGNVPKVGNFPVPWGYQWFGMK